MRILFVCRSSQIGASAQLHITRRLCSPDVIFALQMDLLRSQQACGAGFAFVLLSVVLSPMSVLCGAKRSRKAESQR